MTDAVSPEDESALIGELRRASPRSPFASEVRDFSLGREKVQPSAWASGLARIAERFARRLRVLVDPMVEVKSSVSVGDVETMRWEAWRDQLPGFTSMALYRLRPMKGGLMLVVPPDFVSALVDSFYGGPGKPTPRTQREFTAAEERVVTRITEGMLTALVESWSEFAELQPQATGRETNPAFANAFRPDESILVQQFIVSSGEMRPATLSIAYSLAALRAVESQLSAKVHDDAGPSDEVWRYRLASAMQDVRLPVRSVLARPEITVAELMALKPGDVIPITVPATIPLLVANKRFASGTIGERNGQAAILISQTERAELQ